MLNAQVCVVSSQTHSVGPTFCMGLLAICKGCHQEHTGDVCGWGAWSILVPVGQLGNLQAKCPWWLMDGLPNGVWDVVRMIHTTLMPSRNPSCYSFSCLLLPSHSLLQYSGWGKREMSLFGSFLQSLESWAHVLTFFHGSNHGPRRSLGAELCCLSGEVTWVKRSSSSHLLQCVQSWTFFVPNCKVDLSPWTAELPQRLCHSWVIV